MVLVKRTAFVCFLVLFALMANGALAQVTTYSDRASFEASLIYLTTDDYEHPGYTTGDISNGDLIDQFSIFAMNAVFDETRYIPDKGPPFYSRVYINTVRSDTNHIYCAGCNNSFVLDFTSTSYGDASGVKGVGFTTGFSRWHYDPYLPAVATVTFGDDSTQDYTLFTQKFFGIVADQKIKSIHVGGPDGAEAALNFSFDMDNLTIGGDTEPLLNVVTYETVVLPNEPAPTGEVFAGNFRDPVINNKESFAFGADTSESGCGGIYKSIAGVLSKVDCAERLSQETKVLMENDAVVYSVLGPQIYTDVDGLRSVVGGGAMGDPTPVPDLPEELFSELGQPRSSDGELISFWGLTDKTLSTGIWRDNVGTLSKLVVTGDEAPGLVGGGAFTGIGRNNLVNSENGDTAFVATTSESPETGVWSVDKHAVIRKVIAPDDPAPGSGGIFASAGILDNEPSHVPGINASGEVAFRGVTDGAQEGVWAERWNENDFRYDIYNVVLAGTVVDPFSVWVPETFDSVAINDVGDIAFRACSSIPDVCGLVLASWDENLVAYGYNLVALESSIPAPGSDPLGATFSQIDANSLVLSGASQVAFQALAETGDFPGGAMGIWGWDPVNGLYRVMLAGDKFELAPGDERLFVDSSLGNKTFATTGGSDGRPSVLNDDGRLIFAAFFEDAPPDSEALIIATIPGALAHEILIVSGPESDINPLLSPERATFTIEAEDSFGHGVSHDWEVDCSAWSPNDNGVISYFVSGTVFWTPPTNMTGDYQHCSVFVTSSDNHGLTKVTGFIQTIASEPAPGSLVVTSGANLISLGNEGGPFHPTSIQYLIHNDGDVPIDVKIRRGGAASFDWISLSPSTGSGTVYNTTLGPNESEPVRILFNNLADQLPPGGYYGSVFFENLTNGVGDTERRVALTIPEADGHAIIITGLPDASPNPAPPDQDVQLNVTAVDTHGHALHYVWDSGNCLRRFDDRRRRSPVWNYFQVDTCPLTVKIDDGLGGLRAEAGVTMEHETKIVDFSITPEAEVNVVGRVGGPFFPPNFNYLIDNLGTSPIKMEVSDRTDWLSTPFATGTQDPGEQRLLEAHIQGENLPAGEYTDRVRISQRINGISTVYRNVKLTVNDVTGCAAPVVAAPPRIFAEANAELSVIDLDPDNKATAFDTVDGALTPVPNHTGPFWLGVQTITWGAVNNCGNIGADTQTVTVRDNTPPFFTVLPVDIDMEADGPETYVDLGIVVAEDAVDQDVELTNNAPTDKKFRPGTHIITWTAEDNFGHQTTVQQTVAISQTVALIGMEAVQVSQDLNNSVPLIEGKSTLLRAYFEPRGLAPTAAFNPILTVTGTDPSTGDSRSRIILPTNYGGYSANKTWWPFRDEGTSADYLLPVAYTQGPLELRIDVLENGFSLICDEAVGSVSDDCKLNVDFDPAPAPFELALVPITYIRCDGAFCFGDFQFPSTLDILNQLKRIKAQFPIKDIDLTVRSLDIGNAHIEGGMKLTDKVSQLRRDDGCTKDNNCERFYYGIAVNDGLFGAGGQAFTPGRSSWGEVANNWEEGGNASSLRFVSGQEIGHNLGLDHTLDRLTTEEDEDVIGRGPCNATVKRQVEPFFPYIHDFHGNPKSALGPLAAEAAQWIYGWDSDRNIIMSPFSNFDVMSYCGHMWPSKFTYERWQTKIDAIFPPPVTPAPTVSAVGLSRNSAFSLQLTDNSHLLVRGVIAHDTHAASFSPFLIIGSADTGDDVPGEYLLQAHDEFGNILHEVLFEPAHIETSPTESGTHDPSGDRYFVLAIPYAPELFGIKIFKDGSLLGAISASLSAPTVDIIHPNGGEVLTGDSVKLEWDAQDIDGDALSFNVQFSPDNGSSWIALAVDYVGDFMDVDLGMLPGTDSGIFRVVVSDGFLSSSDKSDFVFSTPNTPPMMAILSPYPHQVYSGEQTVVFKAMSQDVEDGALAPENIAWFSDQITDPFDPLYPLGTGPDLDLSVLDLPLGPHKITVAGTDSDGEIGEASVDILVMGSSPPPVLVSHVATSPSRLWPPNHQMVPVTITPDAMALPELDPPVCKVVEVISNEPDDDKKNNKFAGDWVITAPLSVELRAERSNKGSGREYAITVQCETTDLDGETLVASESGVVTVPVKDE